MKAPSLVITPGRSAPGIGSIAGVNPVAMITSRTDTVAVGRPSGAGPALYNAPPDPSGASPVGTTSTLEKARAALDAAARAAQHADQMVTERLRIGYPATGACDLRASAADVPEALSPRRRRNSRRIIRPPGSVADQAARRGVCPARCPRSRNCAVPALAVDAIAPGAEPIGLFPQTLEPLLHRYLVSHVLGRAHVSPLIVLEATTPESTCSAVAAGVGVAFVAEPLTSSFTIPGVVYRPSHPNHRCPSWAWPGHQDTTSNAVRRLLEIDELGLVARPAHPLKQSTTRNGGRSPQQPSTADTARVQRSRRRRDRTSMRWQTVEAYRQAIDPCIHGETDRSLRAPR